MVLPQRLQVHLLQGPEVGVEEHGVVTPLEEPAAQEAVVTEVKVVVQ